MRNFLCISLERDTGIEPVLNPWEGLVLPLYESRILTKSPKFAIIQLGKPVANGRFLLSYILYFY
jgi:hypothetical protein